MILADMVEMPWPLGPKRLTSLQLYIFVLRLQWITSGIEQNDSRKSSDPCARVSKVSD